MTIKHYTVGGFVEYLKKIINQHFESLFVLTVLIGAVAINHLVDEKIAFLSFYFLPVILSGYFIGAKRSVLGAILCTLMVGIFAVVDTEKFLVPMTEVAMYLSIFVWGCFLILAAAIVGKLADKVVEKVKDLAETNQVLQVKETELAEANEQLTRHSENLEDTVRERTRDLENSKKAIEVLKERVEEALYSTMDAKVAKMLIEGRLRTEKRMISVLFTDLSNFTSYAEEISPEAVVRDLNKLISNIEPIFLRFHAHIDKYLGDGIMAEFGAPVSYERHAIMSVATAIYVQQCMSQLEFPWKMRIGISSGKATLGIIGNRRQSYTAIGDTVNVASRLESLCPPGDILIDDNTYDQIKEFVDCDDYHPDNADDHSDDTATKLKGRRNKVNLFRVRGMVNPLSVERKVPANVRERFEPILRTISFPYQHVLAVETIDGCIGHSKVVAVLAYAMAKELGLGETEAEEIMFAGFTADLGKEIVPHYILNRNGSLTTAEYDEVKKHPEESIRVLKTNGYTSEDVFSIIRHTHERFDGKGYPSGLVGSKIPLGSRIIAIADAYDCLTSWRPYRESWECDAAIDELGRSAESGKFDPQVLKALQTVLKTGQIKKSA